MAEFDREFVERILSMSQDEIITYLNSLDPDVGKVVAEAINGAMAQEALKRYRQQMHTGTWN